MREWTAELLGQMSRCGDEAADRAFAEARALHGGIAQVNAAFKSFAADDDEIPPEAPAPLREFVAANCALPAGLDPARVANGSRVLLDNATLCALVLLLKSLPAGYAAPRLAQILHKTHNLERRPYRRALGVLQMLVNISMPQAFVPRGRAVVTAQKLRLLHAGIRHLVRRNLPQYEQQFGVPVSQLDLVFTIMTFSHHVIEGLRMLGVPLDPAAAEDFFHLWQMYGELQGILPEWMPATLEDAQAFCLAYESNFVPAERNAAGVALTLADIDMLRDLLPRWARALGFKIAPRIYLFHLLGEAAAARVGVNRFIGHRHLAWLILRLPALWCRLVNRVNPDRDAHAAVSRLFFRDLIDQAWHGAVTFSVPARMRDLRRLG